jgi:hypothetical protein
MCDHNMDYGVTVRPQYVLTYGVVDNSFYGVVDEIWIYGVVDRRMDLRCCGSHDDGREVQKHRICLRSSHSLSGPA